MVTQYGERLGPSTLALGAALLVAGPATGGTRSVVIDLLAKGAQGRSSR